MKRERTKIDDFGMTAEHRLHGLSSAGTRRQHPTPLETEDIESNRAPAARKEPSLGNQRRVRMEARLPVRLLKGERRVRNLGAAAPDPAKLKAA